MKIEERLVKSSFHADGFGIDSLNFTIDAVKAVSDARKEVIEKAVEWLETYDQNDYGIINEYGGWELKPELAERAFRRFMKKCFTDEEEQAIAVSQQSVGGQNK